MIWVSLAVMIFTIVISFALLRSRRGDALGMPLVAIGAFTFLYVVQPIQLLWTGTYSLFLTDWQMSKGFLVSALMLACFMWGWLYPAKRTRPTMGAFWDRRAMWNFGFGAACMGLILYTIFLERSGGIAVSYSEAHGHAMASETNTAYLYYGPWLMLSGSSMMIFADPKSRASRWTTYVPWGFLTLFLADAFMGGDRGPLFAGTTTAFISYAIARRRRVKMWQASCLLLAVGVFVIAIFANRDKFHLGEQKSLHVQSSGEALNGLVGTDEYDQEHDTSGQEFLIHAASLDTVDQTGKLDYGVSWIEFLVINPIPRLLWPEKSYPPSPGITAADIKELTSFAPAGGSAAGIVTDIYQRFHLAGAVFFFFLGFGLRWLLVAALSLRSPVTAVGYVMIYAASLNMFAQGFGTIFVPVCYSMAPVVLYSWMTREGRRKARQRHREWILSQAAALHPQTAALRGERWSS
jgi:hypothetical protein